MNSHSFLAVLRRRKKGWSFRPSFFCKSLIHPIKGNPNKCFSWPPCSSDFCDVSQLLLWFSFLVIHTCFFLLDVYFFLLFCYAYICLFLLDIYFSFCFVMFSFGVICDRLDDSLSVNMSHTMTHTYNDSYLL